MPLQGWAHSKYWAGQVGEWSAFIQNTVGITDSVSRTMSYSRTLTTTESITDTVSRIVSYIRTITNTEGITDSRSRIISYNRTLANTVGITDLLSRAMSYFRSLFNTVSISDFISAIKNATDLKLYVYLIGNRIKDIFLRGESHVDVTMSGIKNDDDTLTGGADRP